MRRYPCFLICFLLLIFILASCKDNNHDEYPLLNLVSQYPINIPGISDLSSYTNEDEFLMVNDTLCKVYVISTTGNIIRTLNYNGHDLEGVTYVPIDSSIFVVEEQKKEIVKMDTNGNEILRFPVEVNNLFVKHGPEGITYNSANEHLYLVNEKYPSLLIEMTLSGEIVDTSRLTFAKDYSAVFYDPLEGSLWILSEESQLLAKCDWSGNPVNRYKTGITKGEGLVVDSRQSRIYIISEHANSLFVFSY